MTTQRTIDDLTPEERKRIVDGARAMYCGLADAKYMEGIASDLDIDADTVRQVLREEGE